MALTRREDLTENGTTMQAIGHRALNRQEWKQTQKKASDTNKG